MSSPGFGLSGTPQASLTNLVEQKLRAERVVKTGAGWFRIVAILSIINSVLSMSGAGIRFIFGLGIARFVDVLAHQAGQSGIALDLVINGFVAGVFFCILEFCTQGSAMGIPGRHGLIRSRCPGNALLSRHPCGRFPRLCPVSDLCRYERHSCPAET